MNPQVSSAAPVPKPGHGPAKTGRRASATYHEPKPPLLVAVIVGLVSTSVLFMPTIGATDDTGSPSLLLRAPSRVLRWLGGLKPGTTAETPARKKTCELTPGSNPGVDPAVATANERTRLAALRQLDALNFDNPDTRVTPLFQLRHSPLPDEVQGSTAEKSRGD